MTPSTHVSGAHCIIRPSYEEGELSSGGQYRVRCPVCGYAPSHDVLQRNGVKEIRSAKMMCVTVESHEGAMTQRARVTAPSIEGALKIVEGGVPATLAELGDELDITRERVLQRKAERGLRQPQLRFAT